MLLNLHFLRAVAALAVVYFHTTSPAGLNLPVNIGAHGVDLFFVISGFIITYIGVRAPERFLLRRLVRIVPFYWTATLGVFIAAVLAPAVFRSTRPDYVQLLCSLLFIPYRTGQGDLFPTLILGWSLNYEMYFYLVFQAALLLVPKRAPLVCGLAILAIAWALAPPGTEPTTVVQQFYGRRLVLEFILGIGAYYVFMAAQRHADAWIRRPGLRWLLVGLAAGAAVFLGIEEYNALFGLPRWLVAGLPAFVLVVSLLILDRIYGLSVKSRFVFLMGESSYILYLIHPYLVYGVLRVMLGKGRESLTLAGEIGVIAGLLVACTLVAVLIHVLFERPILSALRRRLIERRSVEESANTSAGMARG